MRFVIKIVSNVWVFLKELLVFLYFFGLLFIDRCRIDVPILFYIPIGFQFEFLWVIRNFFGLSFLGVVPGVVFPVSVTVDE